MVLPIELRTNGRTSNAAARSVLTCVLAVAAWGVVCLGQTATETAATDEQKAAVAPAQLTQPQVNPRQAQAAEQAYLAGAKKLERNDLAGAENDFKRAATLNPGDRDYAMAVSVTREHRLTELVRESAKARLAGETAQADTLLAEARLIDPENPIVLEHIAAQTAPSATQAPLNAGQGAAALPEGLYDRQQVLRGRPMPTVPGAEPAPEMANTVRLQPNATVKSFHLRGDSKDLLRQVAEAYGVRAVFDDSVERKTLRFDLDNVSYAQAMPALMTMAHVFAVPVDATSVLVAKNDEADRERLQRLIEETIYLPGLTTEQINDIANVVRNIFEVKQATVQTGLGSLVLRVPEETMPVMNQTIADLLDGNAEVALELKLYTIDTTRTRNIGATLPTQAGLYSVAQQATALVNANQTLVNQAIAQGYIKSTDSNVTIALALIASGLVQSSLLSSTIGFLGGGLTLTGITANASTTFSLALNASDARAVDDVELRTGDRQMATFRAGTRYPITTSQYSAGVSSATAAAAAAGGATINGVSVASLLAQYAGGTSTTVPQITYEDLGLTLKTTPAVQKSGRVSLHIELKVEALAGGAVNGIPILTSRQSTSDITVAEGESALMTSYLSRTETGAVSGLPGLSELPGFQAPAEKNTETDTSELVLVITPHIVRHRSQLIASPPRVVHPATNN